MKVGIFLVEHETGITATIFANAIVNSIQFLLFTAYAEYANEENNHLLSNRITY